MQGVGGGQSHGGGIISPTSASPLEWNQTDIASFYRRTPHYEQVRRINSVLRVFTSERYLFGAASVGVWHVPGGDAPDSAILLEEGCHAAQCEGRCHLGGDMCHGEPRRSEAQ